jgi:hypothetical protein
VTWATTTLQPQLGDHFVDLLALAKRRDLKRCLIMVGIANRAEADGWVRQIVLHLDLAVEHGHLVVDNLS